MSYTIPGRTSRRAFVVSGAPEEEGGDTATMLDSIMQVLSGRIEGLGATWDDATAIQLYGVADIQADMVERLLRQAGAGAVHGIQWFPSLPPIEGLKLEIDVRSAGTELVLSGA
jgi:hypothetical protein